MSWFAKEWDYSSVPDLTGKIALVTGGSTGLGKHTTLELARKNATVYVLGRTIQKTKDAIDTIIKETGNEKVYFIQSDLMDLKSVTKAADEFISKKSPLHILVNNAGIMAPPEFELSKDEIESQFATNHFAHVQLTMKLLPIIKSSAPSRIVNLSSKAHLFCARGGIIFEGYNEKKSYSPWTRYGETKLANILFTKYLSKSLLDQNIKNVYVNCVHPGAVKTELMRNSSYIPGFLAPIIQSLFLSVERGAKTQVFVATDPFIETNDIHGRYFVPIATEEQPNSYALDENLAKQCWEWTVEILKQKLGKDFTSTI